MNQEIKGVVGEKSILLKYNKETITIQAETDRILFEMFKSLLKENKTQELIERFLEVKERIEKYTNKNFYVQSNELFLKGDDQPIPDKLAEKLLELERDGEDYMPLILFWKKLKLNPSENSIKELYGFVEANNIPITETGDIVVEKGVEQKSGAPVGELVDSFSGRVDNSLGMEVYMNREDVDDDSSVTCSHGLHVGAPDYVRKFYKNSIIVVCTVNPRDVVSVPNDYNNTKMRVCRYIVKGYSDKSSYKPLYKQEDFLQKPTQESISRMESLSSSAGAVDRGVDSKVESKDSKDKDKELEELVKKLSKKTAKELLRLIEDKYGISIPFSPKSKKSIVKRAAIIISENE